jgi:hypothetical protein
MVVTVTAVTIRDKISIFTPNNSFITKNCTLLNHVEILQPRKGN